MGLYLTNYKLLVQLQSVAGRPTFKYRKIVIEPAVEVFWSISKVINATCKKMKNNLLVRGVDNGTLEPTKKYVWQGAISFRVGTGGESTKRTRSKLIFGLCV